MKTWWQQLKASEQKLIIIGSILVSLTMIYFFIIEPILATINEMQLEVEDKRQLLTWMQEKAPQLQQTQSHQQAGKVVSAKNFSGIIEQSLKTENLVNHVDQIDQKDEKTLSLSFKQVSFDALMHWLIILTKQYAIDITQFTVTPQKEPGVVQASLTLQL